MLLTMLYEWKQLRPANGQQLFLPLAGSPNENSISQGQLVHPNFPHSMASVGIWCIGPVILGLIQHQLKGLRVGKEWFFCNPLWPWELYFPHSLTSVGIWQKCSCLPAPPCMAQSGSSFLASLDGRVIWLMWAVWHSSLCHLLSLCSQSQLQLSLKTFPKSSEAKTDTRSTHMPWIWSCFL